MGKFTGEVKTKHCDRCDRKTVHQEIVEEKTSGTKVVAGVLTYGVSLLLTGVKSEQTSYVCSACSTVS